MNTNEGRFMDVLRALVELDDAGRVTLPENVRSSLGVHSGDILLLIQNAKGSVSLIAGSALPADQRWFYHAEMQKRVRGAEADLREGRFTQTRTPDEAQRYLDGLKAR